MGRTIPSATAIVNEEIKRVKRLKRRIDKKYWKALDLIIEEMKRNRHLTFTFNDPEDIMNIPYIIAAKILSEKLNF